MGERTKASGKARRLRHEPTVFSENIREASPVLYQLTSTMLTSLQEDSRTREFCLENSRKGTSKAERRAKIKKVMKEELR